MRLDQAAALAVPRTLSIDDFLNRAQACERDYDWAKAVDCYSEAMHSIPSHEPSVRVEISELHAFALYRWARQATDRREFTGRMQEALAGFEEARGLYRGLSRTRESARSLRCGAMIAFLSVWLASNAAERKRLLDSSWLLTRRALRGFEEAGEAVECARTFDQLSRGANLRVEFEWSFPARRKTIREFVKEGEKMVALVSRFEDSHQMARTTAGIAVCFSYFAELMFGTDAGKELKRKALRYWLSAKKLNEKIALLELAYLGANPEIGGKNIANWLRVLEYARESRDHFLQGWALERLVIYASEKIFATVDPDERTALFDRALRYDEEANQHYCAINFISPDALPSEQYFSFAFWEADPEKRRNLLKKSLELASDDLNRAVASGYPNTIGLAHGAMHKMLSALASYETDLDKRKKLLQDSLVYASERLKIHLQIMPFHWSTIGWDWFCVAHSKHDLTEIVDDTKTKTRLLQEAVADIETSLKLYVRILPSLEQHELTDSPSLGVYHHKGANILNSLYSVTSNAADLRKAADMYGKAADFFRRVDFPSQMSESYWNAALAWDTLQEHQRASENFQLASECYRSAAVKLPQLNQFYLDYAGYMGAWSEVEKARHLHGREEYGQANASYKRAARMHQATTRWTHLTSNYSAWAWLEDAEDLSRRERPEEAVLAFQRAASRFRDSSRSLKLAASKIESQEEMQMVLNLQRATAPRETYCNARIRIEEAKLLDRKGEHYASSQSYHDAIQMLKNIIPTLESKDTREIRLILTLAEAWQIMARAEEEMSPGHFLQAAKFFEKAKKLASNERTRRLLSGHIHLCRALQASAKFADTGKTLFYSSAASQLESAHKNYLHADLKVAASFSKATEQLLDAYMQMNRAKTEKDPDKKARLYLMAEKLLRESASNYGVAEESARKERVERLLEEVIEKREMALSLTALLHAPSVLATTAAFSTPTATQERAVGLNGFEHANIQTRITCDKRALKKGDRVDINLELANAGKALAQLVRWEDAVPAGFELVEHPEGFQVTERSLDLKGRVLAPLKAQSVRLVLKATDQGVFTLQPRIVYIDDSGVSKTNSPEPTEIIVSPILEYLVRSYREDYTQRKIPSGDAGWRTLMEVVQAQHLPRSQVYGDLRFGRTFAKPLRSLVEEGLVEVRVNPGERGRGGRVVKIRVNPAKERARNLVKVSLMPT